MTPLARILAAHPWARCETCRSYLGSGGDMGLCERTGVDQTRYGICLVFEPCEDEVDVGTEMDEDVAVAPRPG